MTDTQAKNIYFLGIGGIGMSAIARYYLLEGVRVGGYDRTETALTRALASEGADIHYEDDPARIAAIRTTRSSSIRPPSPTTTPKRPGSAAAASVC